MREARDLLAWLRYRSHPLGWPGLVGLLALAAASGLQVFGVMAEQEQVARLRTALAGRQVTPDPLPGEAAASQLDAWLASLPPAGEVEVALELVQSAALRHGLAVERADFRWVREADAPWIRYQITLPVRAGYVSVRAWLDEILQVLPGLALDELRLRREAASEGALESQVRLTLFLRAAR